MPFEEYNATVMDHFLNPRNTGELKEPTHSALVRNPTCGDMVKVTLRIQEDRVAEVRFKTFGCAAAIASSSALSEMMAGKGLEEIRAIRNTDVVRYLGGLPENKVMCSVAAEQALKEAFS